MALLMCGKSSRDWFQTSLNPISFSERRGRTCVVCHSGVGRLGTLKYNSFRWQSIRMFNGLPKAISMLSCSVVGFKSLLDTYLRNIVDLSW